MGNAARKARKREGRPFEKAAKVPTSVRRTKSEQRASDKHEREAHAKVMLIAARWASAYWGNRG